MSDVFSPLPLGARIPDSAHAVSCSLPTLRDVRGYEEKDPAVTGHLTSGYPRFVVHPFACQLAEHLIETHPALRGHSLWLVSSARMARALYIHLNDAGTGRAVLDVDGVHGVSHPDSGAIAARAKTFLQNVGGFMSSRQAEDELVRRGLLPAAEPELVFAGDAEAEIRSRLRQVAPAASDGDIYIANCGMNAIYSAFTAVRELQAQRGRTAWIQLGWLYLDTIAILKKFSASAEDYIYVSDVFDLAALKQIFATHGTRLAGLVAELPTNPLIQTPDVAAIAALCREHGVRLILDPSVSSLYNLDVLAHADLVVSSLTKYTASEGDLVAGVCLVNPRGPDAGALRAGVARELEPAYPRDLARLAWEIAATKDVLARIHESMPQIVSFLGGHPAVREVYWALHPDSRDNYLRIARGPGAIGGMVTFTLHGSMETFYDRLVLPKGPSFGMKTTLICPFMYLAHYDLITTPAGRAELAASHLDPDLLRLCVGTEPAAAIIAALGAALG